MKGKLDISRQQMGWLLPYLALSLLGCNVSIGVTQSPIAQSTSIPQPTAELAPITVVPEAPLGTSKNPLVLALPPSTQPQADVVNAGKVLTSLLDKTTGYKYVAVIPPSELELVRAFGSGNAHIGSLSPFGYLLASELGEAEAALAREQNGKLFYGAQFLAFTTADQIVYYDAIQTKNLAEAKIALAQFRDKKPCWTDEFSPSGYVVPLGILAEAGVRTREPAFIASHPGVVRAIFAGGICDFGATYVDARTFPGLEDELPDVTKKIAVVWRVPDIIPYETLVFASGIPLEMRRVLSRAIIDLMTDSEGKPAIQTLYGYDSLRIVQDSQYDEFRSAVKASGLNLEKLIR